MSAIQKSRPIEFCISTAASAVCGRSATSVSDVFHTSITKVEEKN